MLSARLTLASKKYALSPRGRAESGEWQFGSLSGRYGVRGAPGHGYRTMNWLIDSCRKRVFRFVLDERIETNFESDPAIVHDELIGARNQSHPLPTYLAQFAFLGR
jgi:hypothetical protein